MKKKVLNYLLVSVIFLTGIFSFVPTTEAGIYLSSRSPSNTVKYRLSGFSGVDSTALSESFAHWNSSTNITVSSLSVSNNTLAIGSYSDSWFGQHIRSGISGQFHSKSDIKINKKTLLAEYSIVYQKAVVRSTITHEIGHNFGLDDNPHSSKNGSIMNHNRDRRTLYNLTSFDKVNLKKYY